MRDPQPESRQLTPTELELMQLLWRLEEGTVKEVMALLPEDRPLAYTSVSTMLRVLEQKGFVSSRKEGRQHVYVPLLAQADYASSSVQHLVRQVFHGTPSALVRQLIDDEQLSSEQLLAIRTLIEEKLS